MIQFIRLDVGIAKKLYTSSDNLNNSTCAAISEMMNE